MDVRRHDGSVEQASRALLSSLTATGRCRASVGGQARAHPRRTTPHLSLGRRQGRGALRRPPAAGARGSKRQILNEYGVPVANQDGAKTAEELAADKAEEAEGRRRSASAPSCAARRDQVLLDTYLSVEEIEQLRDRRLELIDTQVTGHRKLSAGPARHPAEAAGRGR